MPSSKEPANRPPQVVTAEARARAVFDEGRVRAQAIRLQGMWEAREIIERAEQRAQQVIQRTADEAQATERRARALAESLLVDAWAGVNAIEAGQVHVPPDVAPSTGDLGPTRVAVAEQEAAAPVAAAPIQAEMRGEPAATSSVAAAYPQVEPAPEPIAEPVEAVPGLAYPQVEPAPEPTARPAEPAAEAAYPEVEPAPELIVEPVEAVAEAAYPQVEPVAEPAYPQVEPVAEPAYPQFEPAPEPIYEPVEPAAPAHEEAPPAAPERADDDTDEIEVAAKLAASGGPSPALASGPTADGDEPPLVVSTLAPAGPVSRYRITGPWTFAKMMALEQALPRLRGVQSADFTPESGEAVRISVLSNDPAGTLEDLLNVPGLALRMEPA